MQTRDPSRCSPIAVSDRTPAEFRPEALQAVARKALKRKTGARGLRTILEQVLLDTMYELPSLEHVSKVVVDDAVIEGQAEPYLIYRGNLQQQPRISSESGDAAA